MHRTQFGIATALLIGGLIAEHAHAAPPPAPRSYCPGTVGGDGRLDYPWPHGDAANDTAKVNAARNKIQTTINSFYGFENFEIDSVPLNGHATAIPTGWYVGLDPFASPTPLFVAIPPEHHSEFTTPQALQLVIARMNAL